MKKINFNPDLSSIENIEDAIKTIEDAEVESVLHSNLDKILSLPTNNTSSNRNDIIDALSEIIKNRVEE